MKYPQKLSEVGGWVEKWSFINVFKLPYWPVGTVGRRNYFYGYYNNSSSFLLLFLNSRLCGQTGRIMWGAIVLLIVLPTLKSIHSASVFLGFDEQAHHTLDHTANFPTLYTHHTFS